MHCVVLEKSIILNTCRLWENLSPTKRNKNIYRSHQKYKPINCVQLCYREYSCTFFWQNKSQSKFVLFTVYFVKLVKKRLFCYLMNGVILYYLYLNITFYQRSNIRKFYFQPLLSSLQYSYSNNPTKCFRTYLQRCKIHKRICVCRTVAVNYQNRLFSIL